MSVCPGFVTFRGGKVEGPADVYSMSRMFNHPELLLIALFIIVPPLFGLLWHSSSTIGFLLKWLLGFPVAFLIWLVIVFLFVWPSYRKY